MVQPALPQPEHHAVQFYSNDHSLFTTVGQFLGEGLVSGQPAVMIATPAHRLAMLAELRRRHIDVDQAQRLGDLAVLDAEDTLATFMAGDRPHAAAFMKSLGHLISQMLGGRTRTPVRAYGEMVDVLWKRGNADGAIRLEILWNELSPTCAFQMLCGYSMGNFYKQVERFEAVCAQHSEVIIEPDVLPVERRTDSRSS